MQVLKFQYVELLNLRGDDRATAFPAAPHHHKHYKSSPLSFAPSYLAVVYGTEGSMT